MKALDSNGNGVIEDFEFINIIDQALMSSADTSQFQRISGALGGAGGSKKQPKAADSKNSVTLLDMVKPEHRLNASEVIEHFKKLLIVENRIDTPTDEIQIIFDKITQWKRKAGDLDQQEKMVS